MRNVVMPEQNFVVYNFPELSKEVQDKLVINFKRSDDDEIHFEYVTEDFNEILAMLGFYDIECYWSGFYSQGDGAGFTGRYSYAKNGVKSVKEHAPMDTELHAIVDRLQVIVKSTFYKLNCTIYHHGNYCHSLTMHFETYDCSDNQVDDFAEVCRDLADWYYGKLVNQNDYLNSDAYAKDELENTDFTEYLIDGTEYY